MNPKARGDECHPWLGLLFVQGFFFGMLQRATADSKAGVPGLRELLDLIGIRRAQDIRSSTFKGLI